MRIAPVLALCCAALLDAPEAPAGAWLQEEGAAFVSLGYEITTPRDALSQEALAIDPTPPLYGYTTLYAEYGLRPWLTVGVDAGRDEGPDEWEGVAFARIALSPPDWRHRWALQAGIGQRRYTQPGDFYPQESRETETIARLWLGWGTGFARPFQGGWLAIDAMAEHRASTGGRVTKLDATAGLRTGDRTSLLLQLQTGDYPGSPAYAKLLTGMVRDLPLDLALETSLIFGLRENDRLGLRTALWWRF